ncbi:MAG: beta strand repeat-containing protein [Acidimicrobiia bacterium]
MGVGSLTTSVLAVGLLSAGAATTNGDPVLWAQTQCIASVVGTTIAQNQDITVQAVVPNSVAQSASYDATVPGGTANLPSSASGFTISGYKDIGQTYLFRSSSGSPQITNVVANGGATSNGNPVTFNVSYTNEGSSTAVASASWDQGAGGRITYNTSVAHNLAKNQTVDITGFGKAGYNFSGALVNSVPTTTQFTVTGRSLPISGGTWSSAGGGTITFTTAIPHRLKVGDTITSINSTPARYNRTADVLSTPSDTQFTVAGGATDPGSIVTKGQVDTLSNPGGTGATLGSVKTLTTALLSTATAQPGPLTVPDVTVTLTAPTANATVTTYTASVTTTAVLVGPGDAATVCPIPHANPQTDGISATLVGTGGPTTTSNPSCRPPEICATTTTTLPPAPAVTSVTPTSGTAAGGTSVTIAGSNFSGASGVSFGGTPAASFTVDNGGQITAASPAHAAGAVDVTVTTPSGTSPTTANDQFTVVASPTVTSVTPSSGPASGGTSVTIGGTGFSGATAVKFGTTAAASFTVNNATQITATSPAHAGGTVDVTVTTPAGTSPTGAADQFTFVAAPTVTSVTPSSGPASGGTSVTIAGTNFTGATAVSFGGTAAASFTFNNANQITATAPAHAAGTVDVTVTTVGGTSATGAADQFTFIGAPTVTSVTPSSGPASGGTSVTIMGTGFTGATAVKFGTTAAASFTVDNAGQITATAPAHAAGTVDVTVTTPGGTSATGGTDQFTFIAAPTVTSVTPASGPASGGTSVTIAGTNFTDATAVSFGGTAAASFTVDNAGQITATAPAHAAGTVDVTVTTVGGTSATGAADQFTFVAAPTVTSVTPNTGPTAGGTSVTIAGTDLTGATAVSFGGTAATSFTVDNASQITATSPAHAAGAVDVTVTTPSGTSATSANDQFTYADVASTCGSACITVGDKSILETDAGTHSAQFSVTLSQPATQTITVGYTVVSGTATGAAKPGTNVDFKTRSGTLTWVPNTKTGLTTITKTIAVSVLGDTATGEGDETFQVFLNTPTGGYGLGPGTGTGACGSTAGCATGTILNDDGITSGFTLGVGDGSIFSARNGKQALKIPVTLSGKAGTTVTVDYTITPGTATYSQKSTDGGDFGGKLSGTLTFNAGSTFKLISSSIWPDPTAEPNQSYTIVLSNVNGNGTGVTVIRASGTGTILGLT